MVSKELSSEKEGESWRKRECRRERFRETGGRKEKGRRQTSKKQKNWEREGSQEGVKGERDGVKGEGENRIAGNRGSARRKDTTSKG